MTSLPLIVSETFYSIQGEGFSAGNLAVFLRLGGCNLRCNGFSYRHPQTGEHLGCDTKHVWRKGKKIFPEGIVQHWKQKGWWTALEEGAHLVITGGEPLIQQAAILDFIRYIDSLAKIPFYIEVETNATFLPSSELLDRFNQVNASPKLTHSGEPRDKAYQPLVLEIFSNFPQVYFKFVVASPADIQEIIQDYYVPFDIPKNRIWLMPEGGAQTLLQERRQDRK